MAKDINDIMPKLKKGQWGAVMNYLPNAKDINEMLRVFPFNGRWNSIIKEQDQTFVNGRRIWNKKPEQMT